MKIISVSCCDHSKQSEYTFRLGDKGVIRIEEHRPAGDGDKWFYDIICESGFHVRLFNFYSVTFTE